MMSRHVKLLCFLLTLPSVIGGPHSLRTQPDPNVRGNSFGLENFLYQTYGEATDSVRNAKPKRIRPPNSHRTSNDRGQTYGLENLTAQVYDSSRFKPARQQFEYQRPEEPHFEVNRLRKPNKEILNEKVSEPEVPLIEENTERIRKRITLRRRRKRPTNVIQRDEGEAIGNSILYPEGIPSGSLGGAVPVKTKVSNFDRIQRLGAVGIKSVKPTPQVEEYAGVTEQKPKYSERITERQLEVEVTTEVVRKTISTTKETTTTEKPSTINLKEFLKQQTETLSLSELLQTQNLSLADLLRGSKDAAVILKARQTSSTNPPPTVSYKRKTFNRVEAPKEQEALKVPQKMEVEEVPPSTTPRPNRFYPKIPRIKTGERITHKPEEGSTKQSEGNPEEILRTTKRAPTSYNVPPVPLHNFDPSNRLNELRSKLRNFQRKTNPSTSPTEVTSSVVTGKEQPIEPPTPTPATTTKQTEEPTYKKNRVPFKSSNNPELSVILPSKLKTEVSERRPERITNWTNRLPSLKRFGPDKPKTSDNFIVKPLKVPAADDDDAEISNQSSEENSFNDEEIKTTTKPPEEVNYHEEVQKPEPKDELIELLKSGQTADRLQRILFSRNMTIQELLENREKPTVQMNISQLFSQDHKPEIIKTTTAPPVIFDSLPDFEMEDTNHFKTPGLVYDEPYAEETVPSVAVVELPGRASKQFELPLPGNQGKTTLNLRPDDLKADTSNVENSALWKLSEKAMYYGSSYGYGEVITEKQEVEKPQNLANNPLTESDIVMLETFRRSQDTNRKFKLDLNEFLIREEVTPVVDDIEKAYIPPAVKSAIIASGVVMGIALFVFIAIFAACGWKQRQIRLKGGASSILSSTLTKTGDKSKRTNTLSPVSFKENASYKKTIDFDDDSSDSGTSHASSYLWSTLKNTFRSRTSTLKSRFEKEEKLRDDKITLRRNESRRKVESRVDERPSTYSQDDRYFVKKIDRDRNVINTSFNFKRSSSNNNDDHFNDCDHGY